jgi:hypothetical protein
LEQAHERERVVDLHVVERVVVSKILDADDQPSHRARNFSGRPANTVPANISISRSEGAFTGRHASGSVIGLSDMAASRIGDMGGGGSAHS